ncbi:Conserved membrane protein YqgC [Thermobacillus xylanilyticus]|uniref:Conserved membrane protein YqgC n=1 Tax=Thermobacillus xylanilyticus TaxID=76633 RepID=A0ABM8V8X7_THEXY|nr:Conserved membrane protein YqgC [Thermobacillus xylanilyticus]
MWLDILAWIIVVVLFIVGMAGSVYPILPGALAIYAAFFVYGFMVSFEPFGWLFWTIQTLIVAVLFLADYAVNAWGVKRYGGSRASVVGSTIGVLVGPFVIPAFGLVIGPFAGAVIGELLTGSDLDRSVKVGWGSLVGLFTSVVVKIALQAVMILLFALWLIF